MISNSKLKYFLTVTILSIILFFGLIVGLKLSNNIIIDLFIFLGFFLILIGFTFLEKLFLKDK